MRLLRFVTDLPVGCAICARGCYRDCGKRVKSGYSPIRHRSQSVDRMLMPSSSVQSR